MFPSYNGNGNFAVYTTILGIERITGTAPVILNFYFMCLCLCILLSLSNNIVVVQYSSSTKKGFPIWLIKFVSILRIFIAIRSFYFVGNAAPKMNNKKNLPLFCIYFSHINLHLTLGMGEGVCI